MQMGYSLSGTDRTASSSWGLSSVFGKVADGVRNLLPKQTELYFFFFFFILVIFIIYLMKFMNILFPRSI